MHSIEELRRQIAQKEGDIRKTEQEIIKLRTEIAERESEFKSGDVITWRFGSTRRKGKIIEVLSSGHYHVKSIKKDGSDGADLKVYNWDKIERAQ